MDVEGESPSFMSPESDRNHTPNHHPDSDSPPPPPPSHQPSAAGPRPAPAYSVVNAIIDKPEDGPGPRCGHTLTAVAAVGEEGSPGYIGPRLILFGGATALEGNSAAATAPPPTAGGAGIRTPLPPVLFVIEFGFLHPNFVVPDLCINLGSFFHDFLFELLV